MHSQRHVTRRNWLLVAALITSALFAATARGEAPAAAPHQPLRVLVLSPFYSASKPYADYDYLTRQLSADMVFWHAYPREWDIYHLKDTIPPLDYKAALAPNNQRAGERLRSLLAESWDLIFWIQYDLPEWAHTVLLKRVESGLPLIYMGNLDRLESKDALAAHLAACTAVTPADLGATHHDYSFAHVDQLRALQPANKLIHFPRTIPYPESAIPRHDEVVILTDFWRQVVSQLCATSLPTAAPRLEEPTWPVTLSLTSDRIGADYGQSVALTVKADAIPDDARGSNRVVLAVTDRTGRVLHQEDRPVAGAAVDETFAYTLADLGVKTYAYYVTAWLMSDQRVVGRAVTTVYHYRPWDMRRQWQWSAWEHLYRQPTYHAAAAMKLFDDAGINSLGFGYPTKRSLWWAERYGWRKYGEMAGGRKLWNAPVITTDDDAELRARVHAQMVGMYKQFGNSWQSAALILGSLGEEPGFEKGWGRTYYWKQAVAPPVVQQVFQKFLQERYPSIEALSESWQTPIEKWSDAVLAKKYALPGPQFEPSLSVADAPDDARDYARYDDTSDFFGWYFEKVARFATDELHAINPAIRSFYSLHGPDGVGEVGVAHCHHVYYPKEYQALEAARARLHYDQQPSFSLIWNHYDDPAIVSAGLWSQVANQVTHINFWLGFPLMFNNDMTHTRASMVLKRFLSRFNPVSDLLVRAHVADSGAAMLDGAFIGRRASSKIRSFQSAYTALADAGFPPMFVDKDNLGTARMIFASGATHVGPELASAIRQYVEDGGVLITTAGFATRSEHGRLFSQSPGCGLDQWMGFRFGTRLMSDAFGVGPRIDGGPFTLDVDTASWPSVCMPESPHAVALLDLAEDIEVLGRFEDQTPALLHRKIGQGHLYHMNFLHREWGWPVLNTPAREAMRQIITGIAQRESLTPNYYIESRSPGSAENGSMPQWGSQLFVAPDSRTHYLVVFNDHRSSQLTGRIHWRVGGDWDVSTLLDGRTLAWTGRTDDDAYLDLPLLPGDGCVLRLVPSGAPADGAKVALAPAGVESLSMNLQPVVPHGWPSEDWPALIATDDAFVTSLRQLTGVYEQGRSRRELSYYLFDVNTDNRHGITRFLAEQNWPDYGTALKRALRSGDRFVLTGEDLGCDPATGIAVTTHQPAAIRALANLGKVQGAQWHSASADGQVLVLTIGRGRLLVDRTSVDSIGFDDATYERWHDQWWPRVERMLDADGATSDKLKLDESTIEQWLIGRWLPSETVLIDRFADRTDQTAFLRPLAASQANGSITIAVPQDRRVRSARITATVQSFCGLSNGDFEQVNDGRPVGFRVYGKGGIDAEVKHSGNYSLRIEPDHVQRSTTTVAGLSLGNRNENLQGKRYRLRMWVKAENLHSFEIQIRAMQWGKPVTWENDLWIPVGRVPGGTFDWRAFEFDITLSATRANYMDLRMNARGKVGSKIWIDNMRGGQMPTDVRINIDGEPAASVPVPAATEGTPIVITEGLADMINAYLAHAPIDLNGMAVVPLSVTMQGTGLVTLSAPELTLAAPSKP